MSEIGDAIRRRRKASGLTALALAERLHISPQFVNDIEYGRRLPTPDRVLQFANQWSDVDSAAWLWLLLTDLWGDPIATTMHAWAVQTCRAAERQEVGG
jgi:transcriptional regulator with XRE-family HTH domain